MRVDLLKLLSGGAVAMALALSLSATATEARTAATTGTEPPRDLWHVVLFFMTGETVSDFLVRAGHDDYETYMEVNGLWEGRRGQYRESIEAVWPDYMSGRTDMGEASVALLRALGEQAKTR